MTIMKIERHTLHVLDIAIRSPIDSFAYAYLVPDKKTSKENAEQYISF